ncbi:LLM class flavin-dependent oxidoreductase [Cryobacterium algoricola]|uniref:LLM class flavin-dependent oxidoreductase n=1 Tax=Cryobacterium algoricola TaxID=1259183 RepID=A0ABY2IAX7_9MICO|nr:LLM class flavin-dependent oxidoreductase [Cryobacterium algoricola]TFB85596.1 LLM class flavin-dependent oxidoreductase [Cryobacterium algoricola]
MKTLPISVLDLAGRPAGGTNAEAVAGSIRLAQRAEDLGYDRFWVAEHHNMPAIASSAPPVLISGIAARTTRIRVGSGGVMLPNHAPLVVAEQFGTLHALYGDRIDLGIGRAPGTDGATALALRRSAEGLGVDDFPQQLVDLIGFFHGGMAADNPLRDITAYPGLGDAPEMWLLGSSGFSAQLAGALGLPFTFAHHFAGEHTEEALDLYRAHFEPSAFLAAPHTMIAVGLISDDDPEVVRREALPGLITFLRMRQGKKPAPVSLEEALAYRFTEHDLAFVASRNRRQAVGTPAEVDARLSALLTATGADELMLSAQSATLAGRIRSLEIVAALRADPAEPAAA